MVDYKYAYLIVDVAILFPLWLILYWFRKDLRKEMLFISLVFGVAAPLAEIIYLRNYWKPETFYSIFTFYNYPVPVVEDFLFGFFIGGLAGVIFEEIWGKKISKRHNRDHHWVWFVPCFAGLSLIIILFSVIYFNLNAVYANILIFVVCTLVMLLFRSDLWLDSLMSGILVSLTMILVYAIVIQVFPYIIQRWWYLQNLSGIMFIGIPLEEILWAFGMGLMTGPLCEFLRGLKFKKAV